ncbi:hypothetical protein T484DRAFT_1890993, partial [Baffinella frigidus]
MYTPGRGVRGPGGHDSAAIVVTVHRAKGLPLAPADWSTICRVSAGERIVETRAARGAEPNWDEDLPLAFSLEDEDLVILVEVLRLVPSARPALLGTVMVPAMMLLQGSMPPTPAGSGRPENGVWYGIEREDAAGVYGEQDDAARGEVMLSFTRAASARPQPRSDPTPANPAAQATRPSISASNPPPPPTP